MEACVSKDVNLRARPWPSHARSNLATPTYPLLQPTHPPAHPAPLRTWMIQSTAGMSRPRAATSVHSRMPLSAWQNSKKVVVRLAWEEGEEEGEEEGVWRGQVGLRWARTRTMLL